MLQYAKLQIYVEKYCLTYLLTYAHLTALCPGLPG